VGDQVGVSRTVRGTAGMMLVEVTENSAIIHELETSIISYSCSERVHSANVCRVGCRMRLTCDGTRAENRFRLSAKRTSPFKLAGASVQSTTGS
jgi:hypothetical protein